MRIHFSHVSESVSLVLLIAGCAMMPGCNQRQSASGDQNKVDPVSLTAPKLEPLPATAPVIANLRPVASQGDCAPRYANGLHGTCINDVPCRGFGVAGDNGLPTCACYASAGGCSSEERCDAIKKRCVPEKEPGFGRIPHK